MSLIKLSKLTNKKFYSTLFVVGLLLVVAIGILSPVDKINASPDNPSEPCRYQMGDVVNAPCVGNGLVDNGKQINTNTAAQSDNGLTSWVFWTIIEWFSNLIQTATSWLLWLSGAFLNYVLEYTVIDMQKNIYGFSGINTAWKIVRDLINIAFIFLLIYEGIKIIISQSGVSDIKKFISMIILASLLVNFSLFFTKILIDASNIVTVGIYNSIIDSSTTDIQGADLSTSASRPVEGLSVAFMNSLDLQTVYLADSKTLAAQPSSKAILFFFSAVLFVIVAFVFFAVSIMFVIRYITLIILLMLSPIAYMGMALPQLKSYSSKWWESLNGQLLFAPLYMIMTLVVLTFMSSPTFSVNGSFSDIAFGVGTNSMSLLLNFAVVIGLAIASLVIAKSTATKGSGYIKDATGKLTAFAGGAVLGGSAALMRRTVGAGANSMANNKELMDAAARGDKIAQFKLATYRKAASGSFDARRSKIAEATAGATGVSLGKGTDGIPFLGNAKAGEGGYKKRIEEKAKEEAKYIESLKPTDRQEEAREKEKLEELKKKQNEEKGEAETKVNSTTAEINASSEAIRKLEGDLNHATMVDRLRIQKELDAEKNKKLLIEERLKTEQEVLKNKVELYKKTEETITAGSKEEIKKRLKELDPKYETLYQERGTKYAEKMEKGAFGFMNQRYREDEVTGKWRRQPSRIAMASADSIRKTTKGKSTEQQLAELVKKQRKEANKAAGRDENDDGDGSYSAPVATPAPEPKP